MEENERYSRQTMLRQLGPEGQRRLMEARVLIVGVGGLGSAVATYLAGAGVGYIGLADHDVVSISNLQRQTLYSEAQTGMPKAIAAAGRLAAINSEIRLEPLCEGFTEANAPGLTDRFDLVMDCCDNFATRYLIDDACAAAGRRWVHGALSEFSGEVTVFNPAVGYCYSRLYPDRDYLCGLPQRVKGVIGAVAGYIGCLQACEAIKLIAGFGKPLEGRLLTVDCLEMTTQTINY